MKTDLAEIKTLSDDELRRSGQTEDMASLIESNLRLRDALHKEERAIRHLTFWLLVFTLVLVLIEGVPLVCRVLSQ